MNHEAKVTPGAAEEMSSTEHRSQFSMYWFCPRRIFQLVILALLALSISRPLRFELDAPLTNEQMGTVNSHRFTELCQPPPLPCNFTAYSITYITDKKYFDPLLSNIDILPAKLAQNSPTVRFARTDVTPWLSIQQPHGSNSQPKENSPVSFQPNFANSHAVLVENSPAARSVHNNATPPFPHTQSAFHASPTTENYQGPPLIESDASHAVSAVHSPTVRLA